MLERRLGTSMEEYERQKGLTGKERQELAWQALRDPAIQQYMMATFIRQMRETDGYWADQHDTFA